MGDQQQQQLVQNKPPTLGFIAGSALIGLGSVFILKLIFQHEIDRSIGVLPG